MAQGQKVANLLTSFPERLFRYLKAWDPVKDIAPTKKVVTAFLQSGEKFLVLQRARKDAQHTLWGIPGGKLDPGELPEEGLIREIQEETQINDQLAFQLLGTALSCTPSDGEYALYLFHSFLPKHPSVIINSQEHSSFKWVTLAQFEELELLTAQREAFELVKDKLKSFTNEVLSD